MDEIEFSMRMFVFVLTVFFFSYKSQIMKVDNQIFKLKITFHLWTNGRQIDCD